MKKKKNIYWIYMVLDENILICIFNYKHDENARRWRNILFPHFRTMVLDSGNDKVCDDFIQYPNIYYTGLWNEMKRYSEMGNYEWTGIICSDVEIDDENAKKLIDRIKWLKETKNVGIWQPSNDTRRYSWFGIHNNGTAIQSLYFLEGWVHFIKKEVLSLQPYVDIAENKCGTSIDVVTCKLSINNGYLNVMDNRVLVHHPLECGYLNVKVGTANGKTYLEKTGNRMNIDFLGFRAQCEKNNINPNNKTISRELYLISVASYKERLKTIDKMIESIFSGKIKPDKFVLVCPKEDVKYIPESVNIRIQNNDIELIVPYKELKPHNKYYYSYKKYGDEYNIITIDDDMIYSNTMLEDLIKYHLLYKNTVIARRGHKIKEKNGVVCLYSEWGYEYKNVNNECSYLMFPTGVGGVLYPQGCFSKHLPNDDEIAQIITADDIYLKYLCNLNAIKTFIIPNKTFTKDRQIYNVDNTKMLALTNNINKKNDEYLKKFDLINTVPKRKCLYTCITGDYDTLIPIKQEEGWDYICFSDMDIPSDCWNIREIPDELNELSAVKKQRMIKILPERYLSEYDVTIWIDANITLRESLTDFYNVYKTDKPISLKRHPIRTCIYDECDACIRLKKDTVDNINGVKERYKNEGMPERYGLYETNIIIRDNRDFRVEELMNMWANEVREYSHRDQLSLTYCMWKLNCKDIISEFSNSVFKEYFKLDYKHTPGNYKKREIIDNIVTIDFEEKKEITDVPVLTDINTSQEEKNSRILCLIEDSVPYYSRALCTYFSEYFDTEIVDCKDRKYSLCYSKLPELSKDYDYVLLIKTNVSFSWANQSYIETIANGAKDVANLGNVGVWGLSNNFSGFSMSDVNNIEGDVGQDQIVLLNSKVIHQAKKLDFSNNFIGAGYTDYLCKVSKSLNYKNLINKRIPLRLYSNIEDFDNNSVISLRNAFNKLNNIS